MNDYDTDLVIWSERQAALLRRMGAGERVNDQVDWENVAEEIESLGRSDKRELHNRTRTMLEHLIKPALFCATEPPAGWRQTVLRERATIRQLLKDSPSLKPSLPTVVTEELAAAKEVALIGLADHGAAPRADLAKLSFTPEQVLGPWLPD